MRPTSLSLERDRTLTLTSEADLGACFGEGSSVKPTAVLISDRGLSGDLIHELLRNGCEYFVCFGPASEATHDQIDDIVVDLGLEDRSIVTTWHADETASEVAEFFVEVAGGGATRLIAVLDPSEEELRKALIGLAGKSKVGE